MPNPDPPPFSRRDFLCRMGLAAAGAMAVGCLPKTPAPTEPTAAPAPALPVMAAGTRFQVAIGRAGTYDRKLVRRQTQALLDELGGLHDIVRPGARVVIKTNLTSGNHFQAPGGLKAT